MEPRRAQRGFPVGPNSSSMLFCQLAQADSLREICNGLSCCLGKLVHLGINKAPNKSTLSYANEHRPAAMYKELFWFLLQEFRKQQQFGGKQYKFRFKNKLLSMDSTTISLCITLFPWAKFRRAKGGVKVHVMLDHDDHMPAFVLITKAKKSDVKVIPMLKLNPGSIIVVDRGYNDYAQFSAWTRENVYFVIRQKENAVFEVIDRRELPKGRNILADEIIRLTGVKAQDSCPENLRRIVVWDDEEKREIVLLTNHFDFGATTIAAIYRDHWKIEVCQSNYYDYYNFSLAA
ncbi:MAG: IS4 family transposase [Oligoflexales bacterium]|nr:IS4 family transposase [Oligoflexales bacterium]